MLEVKDLRVRYGVVEAVKGISFQVSAGAIVSLIGANGAGKTTSLRALTGLVRPSGGDVRFENTSLIGVPPHDIVRLGIAHVPEGRRLFPKMTVLENLKMGAYLSTRKADAASTLAMIYEHFPILRQRGGQLAGSLSGGEQQMLAIARALMTRPKLLLLDEPSMGLSPIMTAEIGKVIRQINAMDVSIVLVEQNAMLALTLARYGYVLETGSVVMEGKADELLRLALEHQAAGLQQIAVAGEREGQHRVLLHEDDRYAQRVDLPDDLADLGRHDRREPHRRLVEQQELRPRHERAGDREHLLLAAGERAGALASALLQDGKVLVDHRERLGRVGLAPAEVRAHLQILEHGHLGEEPSSFRYVRDPEAHDLVRRQAENRRLLEMDVAAAGSDEPAERAKARRLARAVRADQADDRARRNVERDALHGFHRAVANAEVLNLEHARARRRGRPRSPRDSCSLRPACPRRASDRSSAR